MKPAVLEKKVEAWHGPLAFAFRFREAVGGNLYEPDDAKREIPVIIIEEGMGNPVDRHVYSAELLARSAAKFNGIKAYADHPTKTEEKDQPERSVRQIVGFYREAHVEVIGGKSKTAAILKVFDGPAYDWAWQLVKEAWAYAKQFPGKNLVGISINAYGTSHAEEWTDGKPANIVDDFSEVQSADIVTAAGAGGGVRVREGNRLRETIRQTLGGKQTMKTKTKEAEACGGGIKDMLTKHGEALSALQAKIKGNPEHEAAFGPALEELMGHHAEMVKAQGGEPIPGSPDAAAHPEPDGDEIPPKTPPSSVSSEEAFKKMETDYKAGKLSEGEKFLFETLQRERSEQKIRENVAMIAGKIKESGIPEAYLGDLAVLCAGKPEADVSKVIETRKALVAPLVGNRAQGAGAGNHGLEKPSKLAESLAASGIKMREPKA